MTKLTESRKKELSEMSGETNFSKAPRLDIPTIKLNGSDGLFYRTDNEGEEVKQEALEGSIEGTVIKVRRSLIAHKKERGSLTTLYSSQHNSWRDEVALFQYSNGESKLLDRGSVSEIRKNYPELRVKQIIYFLLESYEKVTGDEVGVKELVKVTVKGKGLASLYDFFNELGGEHLFENLIRIGVEKEEGELGVYYYNTFEKVRKLKDNELDFVEKEIIRVSKVIEESDNFYKTQKPEVEPVEPEDEVDVNNIPF